MNIVLSSTLFNRLSPRTNKGLPTDNLTQMGKTKAASQEAMHNIAQEAIKKANLFRYSL